MSTRQLASFWKVGHCDVRIQVHTPDDAEKLSRVEGVRLVAWSHCSSYLRVFAANKPLAWARDYVARLTRTNAPFSSLASFESDDEAVGAYKTPSRECEGLNQAADQKTDVREVANA